MVLIFEDCELDPDTVELRVAGRTRSVEPQVFAVLLHLVHHRDRMVSKEELLDEVWHSRFVTESAISSRIKSARQAIGDDGQSQRLIRTVRGRGYQFVGDVRAEPAEAPFPVQTVPSPGSTPAQLPLAVGGFTGRTSELAHLDSLLMATDGSTAPKAVAIAAVSGSPGVGKTALAVHWAHRVADRFPDGQLYVNLRGFDPSGEAVSPSEAVRAFLDAFRVPAERVPAELADAAALYRSVIAGRRVLVVLDNARDAEQVRPLLPGTAGCVAVVTSRVQLTGLVAAEGAVPLTVGLMTDADAHELLVRRLGAARVSAEPQAAAELVSRCAHLPLALSITAARAATNPMRSLDELAAELREQAEALDSLDGGDAASDVRAVLSWSYRALDEPAARLLRLLTLHPGPDVSSLAAASLAGVSRRQASRLLHELAGSSLLTEQATARFALHDLLRAYAAEQLEATDPPTQRDAARHRMLDYYLRTAHAAALRLDSHFDRIDLPPLGQEVTPLTFTHRSEAEAWFVTELPTLLGITRDAGQHGYPTHAWQLAWALADFLERRGHWHDWVDIAHASLTVAERAGDRRGQAHIHRDLARVSSHLAHLDEAWMHACQALAIFDELDDDRGRAPMHLTIGQLLERRGDVPTALTHSLRALDLFRAVRHPRGEAYTLNAVGWEHALLGDHQQALDFCGQALVRLHAIGDASGEADTWDSLGLAHQGLGDFHDAARCYAKALDLYKALVHPYSEALTLTRLGDCRLALGQPASAQEAWTRALAIFEELGSAEAAAVHRRISES